MRYLIGSSIDHHQPALAAALGRELSDAIDGQLEIVMGGAGAVPGHSTSMAEGPDSAIIVSDESYPT